MKHIALGITGASGAIYGLRLAQELLAAGVRVTVLITSAGFILLEEECGLRWRGDAAVVIGHLQAYFTAPAGMLAYHDEKDFTAPLASGSSFPDALVVCPCTMGTVARIAHGVSGTLLERAADVALKEGRPLLLVPRETPLSVLHLENLLHLSRLGVRIVPAMPAFYHHPTTLDDLVNFVVGKVLDQLGIAHDLFARWGNP